MTIPATPTSGVGAKPSLPRNIQTLNFMLKRAQERIVQYQEYLVYADKLLIFGSYLTAVFYTIFVVQMYLGDPLLWASYFKEETSAVGFVFLFTVAITVGIFLSKVKHLAYLRLGFAAQVGYIITMLFAFAIFAEMYSSAASQDAKSVISMQENPLVAAAIAPVAINIGGGNTASEAAKAASSLASCQAALAKGKNVNCSDEQAAVASYENSSSQMAAAAGQATAAVEKGRFDRQDQLRAESYHPVIVFMAKMLAFIFAAATWTVMIKPAIVLVMILISLMFEASHYFVSQSKDELEREIEKLELSMTEVEQAILDLRSSR